MTNGPPSSSAAVASFLSNLGLTQALRGFENDMLVMNEDWERQKVPKAIDELMRDLISLEQSPNIDRKERSPEERKLDYAHFGQDTEPPSQKSINKSISAFLAQNRARNDRSNRAEFLQSLSEKRRKLVSDMGDSGMASIPESSSCARTDAKNLDREVQMKYDIAKNEEGPLRRTVKVGVAFQDLDSKGKQQQTIADDGGFSKERFPGLDERLINLETHLSVRYVPSPPQSLLDRLRFLEDHIIRLEKEYPPWAALHFNQPYRGWPPPPRPAPIIVPSHLTSTSSAPQMLIAEIFKPSTSAQSSQSTGTRGKGKNSKSSLHRAVLERLEVQKAMSDLVTHRSNDGKEGT
jgi:hypothetical protein